MVDFHEHTQKIELSKELVYSHADSLERVDCIVVLNELIVRSTHPRETENASKGWIHQHR